MSFTGARPDLVGSLHAPSYSISTQLKGLCSSPAFSSSEIPFIHHVCVGASGYMKLMVGRNAIFLGVFDAGGRFPDFAFQPQKCRASPPSTGGQFNPRYCDLWTTGKAILGLKCACLWKSAACSRASVVVQRFRSSGCRADPVSVCSLISNLWSNLSRRLRSDLLYSAAAFLSNKGARFGARPS